MSAIADRVAAGAAFLDEHDPQWWRADVERAIDLERLHLSLPDACILGQRCPAELLERFLAERFHQQPGDIWDPETWNFWALAFELSGTPYGDDGDSGNCEVVTWSSALGLNSQNSDPDEFNALTAEWKRVITGRRAAS